MAPRALARTALEKLRAASGDRKRGRWVLWGIGAYGAAALACTAAWLVIGPQAAERTGLRRELFLVNRFAGAPLRTEVSDGISLDFLDEDERFPRRHFSARWRGYWYVPDGGSIAIHGAGDDWLSLHIDGELVLRRYPPDQMHWATEVVTLAAGAHELLVEYEQEAGAHALNLAWSPPSDRMRPFAGHRLFQRPPSMDDVRLAERAAWLGWTVTLLWVAPLLTVVGVGVRRAWRARERYGPASLRLVVRGVRVATVLAVAVIAVRAAMARLPGWNPESLWADDLVYAAIIRSQDLWSMITAPIHVAPGPFLIWRGLYALFPDPEWSLQLLPFACGIASIPVMALVVHSVTRDYGLSILAAALTALNPLLAHYTVFVHQYPFVFLVTALFLLAAAHVLRNPDAFSPRLFGWVTLGGGVAAFFSVTSVFISFPTVNLGAALALRGWRRDRARTIRILLSAVAFNAAVLAAYLFLRARSNESIRGGRFAAGFMPLMSVDSAWDFLARNGLRMLELGLPSWGQGELTNPVTFSWPLPFLALGLVWLLARRPTRFLGLVILGFYAAFVTASALQIYPLGTGRTDIFAFPLSICLFAVGLHLATQALPVRRLIRLAVAILVMAVAVTRPLHVEYFNVDDVHLVDHLSANLQPEDSLILSPTGAFLVAFYGHWPVTISETDQYSSGTMATIGRDRTHYLFRGPSEVPSVERFMAESRPERVWYVGFRTGGTEAQVVEAIEAQGCSAHAVRETQRGRLYRAECR